MVMITMVIVTNMLSHSLFLSLNFFSFFLKFFPAFNFFMAELCIEIIKLYWPSKY